MKLPAALFIAILSGSLGLFAVSMSLAVEPPAPAAKPFKEIDSAGLKVSLAEKPSRGALEIKSNEELSKAITDADTLTKLKKQVDFANEKLLVFSWSGSGRDQLEGTTEGKGEMAKFIAVFNPGLTRDLRPHVKLFVLPQKMEWSRKSSK